MNNKLYQLTLVVLLVLSACGGGSGDGDNSATAQCTVGVININGTPTRSVINPRGGLYVNKEDISVDVNLCNEVADSDCEGTCDDDLTVCKQTGSTTGLSDEECEAEYDRCLEKC